MKKWSRIVYAVLIVAVLTLIVVVAVHRRHGQGDAVRHVGSSVLDCQWKAIPVPEDCPFDSLCEEICIAVTNDHLKVFESEASVLLCRDNTPAIHKCQAEELALERAFNESFLRNCDMHAFKHASELDRYMRINIALAVHFGNADMLNGRMETVADKEYLVLLRLKNYRQKFASEGRQDLEEVVAGFYNDWIEQIESPSGFTRQSAHYRMFMNSDYAETVRPGSGLSRKKALRLARSVAIGLVRSGYRPKWLDLFKDPDGDGDPWE